MMRFDSRYCFTSVLLCGFCIFHAPLLAQTTTALLALPDAPDADQTANDGSAAATFSGRVTDANGSPLEGASVRLTSPTLPPRNLVSDEQGYFTFRSVTPGAYLLEISYAGLNSYRNAAIVLTANQTVTLPTVSLGLTGASTTVRVTTTPTEIAEAQIDEQVHQRLLGVIPNFYTSYTWDAVPLDRRQKFKLAAYSVFDPVTFAVAGLAAGGQQAVNMFGGYGGGFQGYAKRYGADYADFFIGRMLSSAVLPSVFHEDPRYFYKGSGTTRERALYAVERSVIGRNDHGHDRFSYSRVLGFFGAGAISNAYHPSHYRGVGLTLTNSSIDLAGSAVDNLFREFLWRRLTKNLPPDAEGEKGVVAPTPKTPHEQ